VFIKMELYSGETDENVMVVTMNAKCGENMAFGKTWT